jgi:hypothetical protein
MQTNRKTAQTGVPQLRLRTNLKSGATTGGGYVNGVWYPDMSGYCSTGTVPPTTTPPSSSGGYVGGVWYPDMSGSCAV